jgi:tetratricopeptide (TPR) repeat protein
LALECASEAAQHAGQHAPTLTAIGAAFSIVGADAELALSYIERALDIDPSNAWAWLRLGWHGVYTGDINSAETAFRNSIELSPLDPFKFNMLSGRASALALWTDRYDEAIALFEEGIRLNPTATWQYRELITAYYKAGYTEKLEWAGRQLLRAYPDLTIRELSRSFAKINKAIDDQYLRQFVEAGIPLA